MKKIILSLLFIAFAFKASAQVFSALKQIGITDGNAYTEGQGVVVDASGNTYITGRFNATLNFGGTSFTPTAAAAVYIAKYNSAGALQWVNKIDGQTYGQYAFRSNIALDASGNVYLYANFYSSGNVVFTGGTILTLSNYGGLIAKYNSAGVLQWANEGGEVFNIAVDASGNAYTTGDFGGTQTFNGQSGSSISASGAGGYTGFVAKYNANGVIQWVNTMVGGGGTTVRGQGIATDASGNIVTTGIFVGGGAINFSGTNLTVIGNNDIFLLKYNSAGTLQWIKQVSGAGSINSGNGVATDASGNVIMTGSFQGSTNFGGTTLTASGANDSFISKYNSAGTLQWVKQGIGISGQTNYGANVTTDAVGNSYTIGNFTTQITFSGTTLNNATGNNANSFYLIKYNNAGTLQWLNKVGGNSGESTIYGNDVVVDANVNIYTLGQGNAGSTYNFFGTSSVVGNYNNIFLLTLNGCTGTLPPANTTNVTICNNTSTTLSATCAAEDVVWYNSSSVAIPFTGTSYTTPNLTANTTYRVRCENGLCQSAFTDIVVTVKPPLFAPIAPSPTICYNTTASLSAACVNGSPVWYNASSVAIPFTGSPYTTPSLTTNTTYKVRCESGGTPNCLGAFTDVVVTVFPNVVAPTGMANQTICYNTTASLSATCQSGTTPNWYNSSSVLQFTGSPFVTPNLTANTTYKVRCEKGGTPNCMGPFGTDIVVTVFPNITAPTAPSQTICYNTTASLSATCQSGTTPNWYNSSSVAIPFTGSPYVTPSLTTNTTYKVRCESGGTPNCVGAFTDVVVTVFPNITAPTAPSQTICYNTTASLSATCQSGTTPNWYNSSSVAIPFTGSPYTTPSLTTNMTYKVRCESGGTPNCLGAFTDVVVTVFPNITAPTAPSPTICYNTTASLSATCQSGTTPNWYNSSSVAIPFTGSPYVTPTLTTNTTYKVRCESGGTPNCLGAFTDVVVTVFPNVVAPTGMANQTICYNTTASLSATCQSGTTPNWYNSSSVLQFTGSPFVTPNLTTNTTYKVRCEKGGTPNCMGPFGTDVVVAVFPNITAPTAPSQTICYNTTASLSATCQSGTTPNWYNSSSVAIPFTGSPYVTPTLTTNTTYKVRCESGGTPNCLGAFTDVVVTVFPNVVAPTGMANQTICYNTTASLSATCQSGTTPNWYNSSSVLQFTGSPFVTPNLTTNTTYKVRCEKGGTPNCMGPFGTDVVVTVFPNITAPTAPSQTICYNTTASLSATCQSGTTPNWYNSSSVAIPFTGSLYVTPSLTTNTTYKVRCESGGTPNCLGAFTDVVVTVNPIVNVPNANGVTINQNTSTSLSATCTSSTAKWYNTNTGGTLLGTGSYTTPVLSNTTTYYVACETGGILNCVSFRTAQTVTVNQPSFDSATSGNWNVATTWTCNCIPDGTLLVRIIGAHNITVPTTYTGQAKGLQFMSTGKVILQGTGKVNVSN